MFATCSLDLSTGNQIEFYDKYDKELTLVMLNKLRCHTHF